MNPPPVPTSILEAEFPLSWCRAQFPGLSRQVAGQPAVFFDGPAGSQTPHRVIAAVSNYLTDANANQGGLFATSRETDRHLQAAHQNLAHLLGAADPDCVVFGANMTTLTLALSRALARTWRPGDEVLVTQLDHDANVTPWALAARDAGAVLRHVAIRPADATLDLEDLRSRLGPRTRLLAVTAASNAVGSRTPISQLVRLAHQVGALVFLDAVHLAAHALLEVETWGADFLAASAYKFFGPHLGVLWGRRELLQSLPAYKVRPAPDLLPGKWMTGTQNHEGIVGAAAAVDYLADLGRQVDPTASACRAALVSAWQAIGRYERQLCGRLLSALAELPSVRVVGISDLARLEDRLPTVSVVHRRLSPAEVAAHLAERGIFVWHGNFYALPLSEALGLEPQGMVRIGLLHYNSPAEVDRLAAALAELN